MDEAKTMGATSRLSGISSMNPRDVRATLLAIVIENADVFNVKDQRTAFWMVSEFEAFLGFGGPAKERNPNE